MKKWLTFIFLIIYLIDFYYTGSVFLYAQYLNEEEDVEIRVWSLKQQIKIEEEAIRALKGRYRHIVKEKHRIQRAIENEQDRLKRIDKLKAFKREREQERQLFLLRFVEHIELRKTELERQKFEQERKLSEEERELDQLELELLNQRHMLRDRQMAYALNRLCQR